MRVHSQVPGVFRCEQEGFAPENVTGYFVRGVGLKTDRHEPHAPRNFRASDFADDRGL